MICFEVYTFITYLNSDWHFYVSIAWPGYIEKFLDDHVGLYLYLSIVGVCNGYTVTVYVSCWQHRFRFCGNLENLLWEGDRNWCHSCESRGLKSTGIPETAGKCSQEFTEVYIKSLDLF